MKRKILYITSEMLPGYGLPVGGGGIRAWSLGKGLESAGHEVHFSLPEDLVKKISNPPESLLVHAHHPDKLNELINRVIPDIVIFQQWPPASTLNETDIPIVIDLHGSLLIENSYRNIGNFRNNALTKIRTLHKADFFTCAGNRQKYYWWAWLMLSGMDPQNIPIETIPVSLSPDLPQHKNPDEPVFVFGGVSWAWQDPSLALNSVSDILTQSNKGQLKIYAGRHPYHRINGEKYNDLRNQIISNPRVQISDMIGHEELIKDYSSSTVAIDLMQRNPERELAFTTRTIEYLWCGLPVIYGDYLELSFYIKDYSAGWILDPSDAETLQDIIRKIIKNPEMVDQYSQNAQKLVKDKFTWDKTIKPLAEFCNNPVIRIKSKSLLGQCTDRIMELEKVVIQNRELNNQLEQIRIELDTFKRNLDAVQHDLNAIRSKTMFKFYKAVKRWLRLE